MAQTRRFTDPSQPQTLQIAVILLYLNGIFSLIGFNDDRGLYHGALQSIFRPGSFQTNDRLSGVIWLLVVAGMLAGGYLIANERKLGYRIGLAVTGAPLVAYAIIALIGYPHRVNILDFDLIGLAFTVARFALLYHPQSRSYQRIWFK